MLTIPFEAQAPQASLAFTTWGIFQGAVLPVRVGTKAKAAPKRDRVDQNLQKAGVGAALRSCQQLSAAVSSCQQLSAAVSMI